MGRTHRPWFRKGRGWYVELQGRQVRLVAGKSSRREAERIFAAKLAELDRLAATGGDATVAGIVAAHLAWSRAHNKPETVAEKVLRLEDFAAAFRDRTPGSITPAHVLAWVDAHPSWRSAWTKSNAVKYVRAAFQQGVRDRLIDRNPIVGMTMPKGGSYRPLRRAEYGRLTRAARGGVRTGPRAESGRRFRELLAFLGMTGARPGEARSLRWSHIDLEKRVVTLAEHKTSKSTGRPRVIVLTRPVVKVLALIASRDGTHGAVFRTCAGLPWSRAGISQRVRQLRTRAGLPDDCVAYGLRHAYGTCSIVNGTDVVTLATLMGHSTARMTERYIHLAGEHEHLAAAAEKAIGGRRRGET